MNLTIVSMLMAATAVGQSAAVKPPPMPDFKKPVDYVAWYQDQLQAVQADNALKDYATFLYSTGPMKPEGMTADDAARGEAHVTFLLDQPRLWEPENMPALDKWINAMQARYVAALLEGNKKPHFALKSDPKLKLLTQVDVPPLSRGRTIGQLLIARAWRSPGPIIKPQDYAQAIQANLVYVPVNVEAPGLLDDILQRNE